MASNIIVVRLAAINESTGGAVPAAGCRQREWSDDMASNIVVDQRDCISVKKGDLTDGAKYLLPVTAFALAGGKIVLHPTGPAVAGGGLQVAVEPAPKS